MSHPIIDAFEKSQMKADLPQLRVGDLVKVSRTLVEGKKSRTQVTQGTIIKMQNAYSRKTITVRRVVDGVGIEQSFLINSPLVTQIDVLRRSKVRRAKLYYLRSRLGAKATRLKAAD